MQISQTKLTQASVIQLAGSIDALTADQVSAYFEQQFNNGEKNFIADFSQVDFMSSAGLRVLIEVLKRVRREDGDLRLAGAQPGVENVLTISGFTTILQLYPTVEAAIASFNEG
jgi:anti-anti-sigma factor